jgi:hypothetical protein
MIYRTCRRPLAWLTGLLVLAVLATAPCGPARAQAEALTVEGIAVDVTADSAQAARDLALTQGQRKAFDTLMQRLVQPQDLSRLPQLSDAQIADMVLDFGIGSEQTSAVRYIGKLNFRFDGGRVRALLNSRNIAFMVPPDMESLPPGATSAPQQAPGGGGSMVVLPVFSTATDSRLFDSGSLWRDAWTLQTPQAAGVTFTVPNGDAEDVATIGPEEALLGDPARLASIAQRYGTDTVLVAEARLLRDASGQRIVAVQAQRFGPAGLEDTFRDQIPIIDNDYDPAFIQAVQHIAAHTRESWSGAAPVSGAPVAAAVGPEAAMRVSVPIRQLSDWLDVQNRLSQAHSVTRTEVRSMLRNEVRLDLYYTGGQDQLVADLARSRLTLTPTTAPGLWLLRQAY